MKDATTSAEVEIVIDLHARLGEGPRWDHRRGLLAWVDILSGLVHLTDVDDGVTETIPVGRMVGALALWGDWGHLLAVADGFATLADGEVEMIHHLFDDPGRRLNDGAVDPVGRFLAGSMASDAAPRAGSLYSRDIDGSVRVLLDGVTISNGIAWSADGSSMFYVDSPLQGIDVMDYDAATGAISNRRRWVDIPEEDGTPDGMTIDADGCIWLALWDGGKVRRYSPDGEIVGEIGLPVPRVTSCAFGGPNLDRLFITTASAGVEPGRSNGPDGALFVADPGCRGLEERIVPALT